MDPLSLISGGMNLLGSIFGAKQSGENTQAQIQASMQQQATQNAFSERMSSTAYQRATKDMTEAGLNPMMMFGSGGPASSPAGSGIQAPTPQTRSTLEGMGHAASQAITSAVAVKSMEKMTDEVANLKVQRDLLGEQINLARAHGSESTSRTKINELEAQIKELYRRGPATMTSRSATDVLEGVPDIGVRGAHIANWGADRVVAPLASTAKAVRSFFPSKHETTRSGSRWQDQYTGENHYQDTTFEKRWPSH